MNNLFVSVSMDAGAGSPPSTQLPDVNFSDQVAEKQTAIGQQISTELAGAATQQDVFNTLATQLQHNLGFLSTRIFGYTTSSSTLTLLAAESAEDFPAQSPSSAGSIQAAADSRTTIATQAGTPENPTGVLYPEIAVPMHSRGQVFGVLNVHVESNESLNSQNRFFLEMLTSQVSLVLHSISQRQSDGLSGAEPQLAPEMTSAANWRSFKEISALKNQLYSYDPNLRTAVTHEGQAGLSSGDHPSRSMQVQGEVIGALGISTQDGEPLTAAEQSLLDSISEEVSQALERAQLFESSKRSAAELAVLNEMGNLFSEAPDEEAIVDGLYTYSSQLIDAPQFYVAYYDVESDTISFPLVILDAQRVTPNHPAANDFKTRPAGTGLTGHIIKSRQAVLIENNAEQVLGELGLPNQQIGSQTESWLGVPMTMGDQVLGVISIQSDDKAGLYNQHHLELLSTIASQAAVAINNIRLFEQEQARAEQERLVRTITDRVRRGTDTQSIMRIAIEELSQVLNAEISSIQLGTPDQLVRSEHRNTAALPPIQPDLPTTSEIKLTDLDSFLEDID
ncbi:MAG: GAF domain-containing protein [Chloroflexota bacterium]